MTTINQSIFCYAIVCDLGRVLVKDHPVYTIGLSRPQNIGDGFTWTLHPIFLFSSNPDFPKPTPYAGQTHGTQQGGLQHVVVLPHVPQGCNAQALQT